MTISGSSERYSATARRLHWITVALVIVLTVTGKVGIDADEPGNQNFFWHSSLGVLVVLVAVTRIIWAILRRGPALPASMSRASRLLARSTHVALYLMLFALPVTGWLAASAEGATVSVFGAVALPRWELPQSQATVARSHQAAPHAEDEENNRGAKNETENSMGELHETLGNVLLIFASLHAFAAFVHRFYWRDGILERMLPRRMGAAKRVT